MERHQSGILRKGCMCGHDHETARGEHIDLCLECRCVEEIPRCQNCGAESIGRFEGYDACSQRCALQIEYAVTKEANSVAL